MIDSHSTNHPPDRPQPNVEREEIESRVKEALGYVSVHGTVALFCIGLFSGYLGGWYIQAEPDMTGAGALVAIILVVMVTRPVKIWLTWLEAKPEEEIINAVMHDLEPPTPVEKKKANKNAFDEEDFDEPTRVMILKMVKQARKNGIKVTAQQFFTTVLKSIH